LVQGPEKLIVNKIRDALKRAYPDKIFIFKSAGGPFQQPGLPDLMMCIEGRFIGIEVKTPNTKSNITKLQQHTLDEIGKAGGLGFVCWSAEDAVIKVGQWMNGCLRAGVWTVKM
jgi:hypothetical protein